MHGVAGRLSPSATAFPHRGDHFDFSILSQCPDATATEANIQWTGELYSALLPHVDQAVYVNNLGNEGSLCVRAAYGPSDDLLAEIKAKYDLTNLFHLNQNMAPRN
jgi:hypothetical protein